MFHVVLVEPQIPPNTGNVGRLCLANDSRLHLIEPLGFSMEDRYLRRAGLDYWADVDVRVWPSLAALREAEPAGRFFFFSTKAERNLWSASFQPGDFLVFGCETRGLPEPLLRANWDACFRIPIANVRSLNLATSAGIVLYEAVRQCRTTTSE